MSNVIDINERRSINKLVESLALSERPCEVCQRAWSLHTQSDAIAHATELTSFRPPSHRPLVPSKADKLGQVADIVRMYAAGGGLSPVETERMARAIVEAMRAVFQ